MPVGGRASRAAQKAAQEEAARLSSDAAAGSGRAGAPLLRRDAARGAEARVRREGSDAGARCSTRTRATSSRAWHVHAPAKLYAWHVACVRDACVRWSARCTVCESGLDLREQRACIATKRCINMKSSGSPTGMGDRKAFSLCEFYSTMVKWSSPFFVLLTRAVAAYRCSRAP